MSPKAFQLLEILLENQPKAMAKGMLQEILWPDTFVVEKNLANLVGEIREALGDSAGGILDSCGRLLDSDTRSWKRRP